MGSMTHSPSVMRRSTSTGTAMSESRYFSRYPHRSGHVGEEPHRVLRLEVVREDQHTDLGRSRHGSEGAAASPSSVNVGGILMSTDDDIWLRAVDHLEQLTSIAGAADDVASRFFEQPDKSLPDQQQIVGDPTRTGSPPAGATHGHTVRRRPVRRTPAPGPGLERQRLRPRRSPDAAGQPLPTGRNVRRKPSPTTTSSTWTSSWPTAPRSTTDPRPPLTGHPVTAGHHQHRPQHRRCARLPRTTWPRRIATGRNRPCRCASLSSTSVTASYWHGCATSRALTPPPRTLRSNRCSSRSGSSAEGCDGSDAGDALIANRCPALEACSTFQAWTGPHPPGGRARERRPLHGHLGRHARRRQPRDQYREFLEPEVPRRLRRLAGQVQEPVQGPRRHQRRVRNWDDEHAQLAAGRRRRRRRGHLPEHGAAVLPELRAVRPAAEARGVRAPAGRHPGPQPLAGRLLRASTPSARAGIGQIFLNDVDDAIEDVQLDQGARPARRRPPAERSRPTSTGSSRSTTPTTTRCGRCARSSRCPVNCHGGTGVARLRAGAVVGADHASPRCRSTRSGRSCS